MDERVIEIIDIFEDFLKNRNIEIPTSVQAMKEDNNYEGNSARIYGEDYGELQDELESLFETLDKEKENEQ